MIKKQIARDSKDDKEANHRTVKMIKKQIARDSKDDKEAAIIL